MFYIFDMKNFDSTEFGKRLGILMTETNMTQSMLAAKIDVSQRAVSKGSTEKASLRRELCSDSPCILKQARIFFSDFRTTETPTLFCPRICRARAFSTRAKTNKAHSSSTKVIFTGLWSVNSKPVSMFSTSLTVTLSDTINPSITKV